MNLCKCVHVTEHNSTCICMPVVYSCVELHTVLYILCYMSFDASKLDR